MHTIVAIAGVVILEMIRRKDVYVLLFITGLITLLLASVDLFGDPKIVRYLREICLTLIWISSLIIAITTAARQIPSEKESRTLFPLLAKPVTRGQVILGKFFGCWVACGVSLMAFYTFFCLVNGARDGSWPLANYLQAYWLHCVFCGIVVALTLFGSVFFTAVSSNSTIMFVAVTTVLVLGRHLHKVAVKAGGLAGDALDLMYFAVPHLEWYDVRDLIIHSWPTIHWGVIFIDTLYGAAYGSFFLVLAWLRFRRMALN
jgi:ABC-type transport system involved in multi-copper enzyme maturation permease subunit